ncbi:MAG: hypothetical protein JWP63_4520 [Candidatus Solibacter sp.]|nr:hypothetical protein [Candidatus Solibacter sp.]
MDIRILALFALSAILAPAQTVSGSVAGNALDPSGAPVPDALVRAVNQSTAAETTTLTDDRGAFVINGLLPGTYSLRIAKTGFRPFEQTALVLTAGERRSAGTLRLELGAVTDTISVEAEAAAVQTISGERSGVITNRQVTDLMLIGRDYLGLMPTLPGVADLSSHESPAGGGFNMAIQGNRPGTNNLTIDGASNLNSGSSTGTWVSPGVDSIAQVKVLLNNYQAEYGRNSGVSVNVITKGGTAQFHGTGYYFKRNEVLNANNYFNNQRNQPRPRYRYDFGGFNIGGPITIPGRFNTQRNRLFFFFAQDFLPQSFPNAQSTLTVPTALERNGDFSATVDQNGKQIAIKDPLTGLAFPGNVIPANRINPGLQKLLNVFPLPNYQDPTGASNYLATDTYSQPRYETLVRVDYRIAERHTIYFRGIADSQNQSAAYGVPAQGGNWALLPSTYQNPTRGALVSLTDTLSPTMIHEFTFGLTRGVENVVPRSAADLAKVQRDKLGIVLPEFHPEINSLNLIPQASFGGVSNGAAIAFESRYPFGGVNNIWDLTDAITKNHGAHNLKAGIFVERVQRWAKRASTFNGSFDFSKDVNNPLDSNYAYSNALLGVYRSYSESDARPQGSERFTNFEWYAQDTWKLTRKLTLDYGVRFAIVQPQYEKDERASAFNPFHYDFSKKVVFIQPVRNAAGGRVGFNPVTGQTVAATLIGAIASGDPLNGIVTAGTSGYPRALYNNRGVQYGPRFGFAYDPTGKGKTAIRGGFGIAYNREDSSIVLPFTENPPFVTTPTSYYGNVADLASASRNIFPNAINSISVSGEVPTVMNYSLGVQHDIGFNTVLDIAYAGNLGRHLRQSVNLNAIAPGANFLAANQDPSNPGKPLPADFLRPFPGLGNINQVTYDATSNYNSLQVQAHRRFTAGLEISGVWTWSKVMSTSDNGAISPFFNERARYYGLASFDRTHIVNINWVYDLPRVSRLWNNSVTRQLFDRWQLTGIASFISGAPQSVSLTTSDGADISGSPTETPRVDIVGNPVIDRGSRGQYSFFNPNAFARPAAGALGNAGKYSFRGPGINNWDAGLYKNVVLKERYRFQLRGEAYNIFNHTQFDGLDTTARFDAGGRELNTRLGQAISARNPRRLQLALKFLF